MLSYDEADAEVFASVGATRPLILQVPPCLRAILESPFLLYYQAGIVPVINDLMVQSLTLSLLHLDISSSYFSSSLPKKPFNVRNHSPTL